MIKKLLILILTVSIASCGKVSTVAELGKHVPDHAFTNVLNSKKETITINELKGKIVILEFWATWCGPCIPAMKKLDSLQIEFKDEIEVLTISNEDEERLEKFIKSTNTNLKIATDTLHTSKFRYKIIPHSIIIDKNGIVRAITNPENINRDVLKNLINKNEISLEFKDDFYIDPTLKVKTIEAVSTSKYRIELKGYDQEKNGGSKKLKDIDGNINGIEMWNSSIPRLFQTLFDISSPNRMVFKDSMSYADFPYDEKGALYNMTIEADKELKDEWKQIGIDFLNQQFDVNARMGIDTLDCFVLKKLDDIIKESTADESEYMYVGTNLNTKKIKLIRLAEYLENFTAVPVVDKTNLTGEYDIELEWQAEDPKTLHFELNKYGLKLEKSDTKLPVEVMEVFKKKIKTSK